MSCPFTETRVNELTNDEVVVEWPWWTADPDSGGVPWNGLRALPAGPGVPGWDREVFRIRPRAADLDVGANCHVGIPPTALHVIEIRHFDPPQETGWLPRPHRTIECRRVGQQFEPGATDSFDPDDGIPRRIELRFRPYAFLEPGDEVADAQARVWRFETAWDLRPFDGRAGAAPAWPLMLLTRHGDGDDDAAAVDVVEATQTGSHHEELARWAELAGLEEDEPAEPEIEPAE